MNTQLDRIEQAVGKLSQQATQHEKMIQSLIEMQASVNRNIEEIREDISELKDDVSTLKSDVAGLKSDVAGLKSDVENLKADNAQLHVSQKRTESVVESIAAELLAFKRETTHNFRRLDRRLDSFEKVMDDTIDRIERLEAPHN